MTPCRHPARQLRHARGGARHAKPVARRRGNVLPGSGSSAPRNGLLHGAGSASGAGTDFACILALQERGASRASATGVPDQPAALSAPVGPRGNDTMTTTDIGILLIVLCVLLWAIMAALHRHTVQMKALQAQLDELLGASRSISLRGTDANVLGRNDHGESRAVHASGEKRA